MAKEQPIETVRRLISDLSSPEKMSPEQAISFLDEIIDDCQMSIDALRDEMRRTESS